MWLVMVVGLVLRHRNAYGHIGYHQHMHGLTILGAGFERRKKKTGSKRHNIRDPLASR